jgi:hypothetical protein
MINWKTCIGLSLLMIAGIELLEIKDNYHPDRLTPLVIGLISVFTFSVTTAAFLILNGLNVLRGLRRVTRKKVTLRRKEIATRAANVREVRDITPSAQGI